MKSARKAEPASTRTEANVPVELTFTASRPHADPFNDVDVDVVFVDPQGRELRVPAFWAGGSVWKVRYASPLAGRHPFRSECIDTKDTGLHGISGAIEVVPYSGSNPLYRHGPLRVSADKRHLEHQDGTPFFWLGDTWWMGLCHRIHWPEDFRRLAADRVAKGFNVVQIVAGLYPDMPAFDPRGANETGFPWEENYTRIRPEYYDAADQRLRCLVEQGLMPCLVGAWGYFIPWMGVKKLSQHWRYLIARYGAYPMAWCIAGEANLPWYLAKNFPCDDRNQSGEWTKVIRYVRENDPYRRPITIHPTAIDKYTSRNATSEPALLDFDILQTPHAQNEGIPVTIAAMRDSYNDPLTMPVLDGEPCYEMLGDNLTAEWPRRTFWTCLLNGAAGHTYGANGIWQCNRADQPHGPSPHGGDYGKITWEEAMRQPGSTQVAIGKRFFLQYPWTRFRPHPEWAEFTGDEWISMEGAQRMWSDAEKPLETAPNTRRYFRKTFTLPADRPVARARFRFVGSAHVEARLNDEPAGVGWHHQTGDQFDDRARLLRPGKNVFTVWVEHRPATKHDTGLAACLEILFADGETLRVQSGDSWKLSSAEVAGWLAVDFDDSAWAKPAILGREGDAPWGPTPKPDLAFFGPQAAGIPGAVCVVYVPYSWPVVVKNLGERQAYRGEWLDPVTGTQTSLGRIKSDAKGEWRCPPPAGLDHDWIIVLEAES